MQTYTDKSKIHPFETSPQGHIHFHKLVHRLQAAATAHAESGGFGLSDLHQKNQFWVITSLFIKIKAIPVCDQNITLKTWSRGAKKLRAFRDFIITDENDKTLVQATSQWMILDIHTSKPLNIDALNIDLNKLDQKLFETEPKRLKPSKEENLLAEITAPYSALDANGHVNNSQYTKWSFDIARVKDIDLTQITEIQLSYLCEAFENDAIKIKGITCSDNSFNMTGFREADGKNIFAICAR